MEKLLNKIIAEISQSLEKNTDTQIPEALNLLHLFNFVCVCALAPVYLNLHTPQCMGGKRETSRALRFDSQYIHGCSQPSVTSVSMRPNPILASMSTSYGCGTQTYMETKHLYLVFTD